MLFIWKCKHFIFAMGLSHCQKNLLEKFFLLCVIFLMSLSIASSSYILKFYLYADIDSKSCKELGKYKPNPKNCKDFYQCSTTGWVSKSCSEGSKFDPVTLNCDHSQNVQCENDFNRGISEF